MSCWGDGDRLRDYRLQTFGLFTICSIGRVTVSFRSQTRPRVRQTDIQAAR